MNTNMMELNMDEMEMVNGGFGFWSSLKGFCEGAIIGGTLGAMGGAAPGALIGIAVGGVAGAVVGGITGND